MYDAYPPANVGTYFAALSTFGSTSPAKGEIAIMFDKYGSTALGILLAAFFLYPAANDCTAQSQTGILTGTLTTPDKRPVNADSGLVATGVFIDLPEHARAVSYNPGDFRTRGVFGDYRQRAKPRLPRFALTGFTPLRTLARRVRPDTEGGMLPDGPSHHCQFLLSPSQS